MFKSVSHYQSKATRHVQHEIAKQQRLLAIVRAGLPEVLAQHCLHVLIKENTLWLFTDSAAWSSQLRFFQAVILNSLHREEIYEAERLQVRIYTPPAPPDLPKPILPSHESITQLKKQAQSGNAEDELQAALLRLSCTLEKAQTARK